MFRSIAELFESRSRFIVLAGVVLLAAFAIVQSMARFSDDWPYISGWEYEWIADALARGEGFSFPGRYRWLFNTNDPADHTDPAKFYATAWEEPVYPLLLGGCFWLLGEQGRVVMLLIHVLCFLATLALVYHLGKRVASPAVGFVAAVILAVIPRSITEIAGSLVNTSLAGLLVCVCVLMTLSCLQNVTVRRAMALGAVIGISALTHAATMIFGPLAAMILLAYGKPSTLPIRRSAVAVVFATAIVISPWAIRNYATFGHLVPVRTGFGFIADLTNPALAQTFKPATVANATVHVPWTAPDPGRAWLNLVRHTQKRIQLLRYPVDIAKSSDPSYLRMNEAERDRFHLKRAISFFVTDPGIAIRLTLIKAADFYVLSFGSYLPIDRAGVVAILAIIGVLLKFRNRQTQILVLFILAYSTPYIISGPLFYRYRYPIEPLMAILAGIAVIGLTRWGQTGGGADLQQVRPRRSAQSRGSKGPGGGEQGQAQQTNSQYRPHPHLAVLHSTDAATEAPAFSFRLCGRLYVSSSLR